MPMEETTKTRKVIVVGTPTDKFDIPFDYLAKKFVKVYQEGILLEALVDYDFITTTRIQMLKGAVATGQTIEIRRETSATARLVSFRDASVLTASDLDISALQSLHLSEEARDSGLWAEYTASIVLDAAQDAASTAVQAASTATTAFGHIKEMTEPVTFRSVLDKLRDTASVRDFGAKGDCAADDTAAIIAADRWCAENGHTLYFPQGVYLISDGIESFADWEGAGAPNLGTFNLQDDKKFLVEGSKHKIPGSVLLFKGNALATFTTQRTDRFSTMRYVVRKTGRSAYRNSPGIRNMGIVADFDFRDASGAVTTPLNDNAQDIDVGLLLHNVEGKHIANVCVGGYYKKAGTVHFGIDPDNTHMTSLRTMGDMGLAVIGDLTGTNSGLNCVTCFIGANDHHSRSVVAGVEKWGTCALYIDIPASDGTGSRNGISFIGGTVTTKTNVPMMLDRCGAINFTNVVFENASQAGSGTAQGQAGGTKRFIGSANTGDIGFLNCRLNAEQIKNAGALLETAPNANITIVGGNKDYGMEVWRGASGVRMNVGGSEQNFQLTNSPSSITSGVRFRRTSGGTLEVTCDTSRVLALGTDGITFAKERITSATVVGGAVSVGSPLMRLSGGTVDLTTITPVDGINRITLLAATTSDIITLKTQTGNLRITSDFVLSGFKSISLIYNGVFWIQDGGRPA